MDLTGRAARGACKRQDCVLIALAAPVIELKTADSQRIKSIDALRGLVMLIMLLDPMRERFFLHRQVSDPMAVESTEPALLFLLN